MAFYVALVQLTPKKADVDWNLSRIAESIQQAQSEGCDLVCFSETSTTGYFLEGGVLECSLTQQELLHKLIDKVGPLDKPIDALVGFYERAEGNLYNSAAYLQLGQDSKVVHVYRKFFLPTYGVFDEERFVSRGTDLGVFETRLGKFAILICEDVWHSIMGSMCAAAGAQLVLIPSASPARDFEGPVIGNHARYQRMLRGLSDEHGIFCANVQLTGFEGGKGFIGGSSLINPFGESIAEAPIADECMLIAEIDLDMVEIARAKIPLTSDMQSAWSDIQRLVAKIN